MPGCSPERVSLAGREGRRAGGASEGGLAATPTVFTEMAASKRGAPAWLCVGPLGPGLENSPEGENGMSRVYLGVHWLFDQQDGMALGNAIAEYAASHYFQAVPEPSAFALVILAVFALGSTRRAIED